MKLRKMVIYCILSFCRLFLVFYKINPKKITFISLESEELTGDFALLSKALEREGTYELNYVLVKFEKTLSGNLKYLFVCIKQLFEINTSKLVILDYNNYVVSKFKRKNVKVLQLWHATGAIKKFGNAVNRDYLISNYDYVISNCDYFVEPFSEAFNVRPEQVRVTGIPKTDRLFDRKRIRKDVRRMQNRFPQIIGKKVILYAPTFRGRLMKGFQDGYINLDKIQENLGDDYVLLYKMHPLLEDKIISENKEIICCNGMSIKQLFSVTDILISDYSAIILDFSVFVKPMLFYVPDLEEYRHEVGLYVDYEKEMPGPICKNETEVIETIVKNKFDMGDIQRFKDRFFKYQDGKSLTRVMKLINEIMGGEKYEKN
ncbi:CDP-glycerol glycerophosphotransferase (TagB/SpsB family) [Breznakia sp. PF5-3]|uniref:CDP-glycerol glycerophosphotransferase family protein n=1 Tax=unclassified Breznakia TaxID=2623764 RepID=UPI0024072DA6|nr:MULTISPECIES: CDP-glycerol glycerophosphotransferase family protein [unclassified Breznakia]MDF9824852.1 CDP-glycerol glycerophosphotransferase (TagB/SpsB family) [Breznakia sp. PM6-1]MDF9835709.1 CDP-glycerol glycerophosphotransferase (TagB/SpsB family) [Breznakia sp. PF5-3]